MKKKLLFISLIAFLTQSCGTIQSGAPHTPPIPPDPGGQTESDDYIEVRDLQDKFFVGETFEKCYRLNITLHQLDETVDLSNKPSYVNFTLKDPDGKTFNPSTPFTKSGIYKYQVSLAADSNIKSDELSFVVTKSPTVEVEEKSQLPSNFTYKELENSCLSNYSFPSKGTVYGLVIPVEISDYPFISSSYGVNYQSAINRLFNGNGETDTGYWESVASYYKKASKNQLKFDFEIAETFRCGYSSEDFVSAGEGKAFDMARQAIENYKYRNGSASTTKFDNDHDGYIDGLWLVYSAPDYSKHSYGSEPGRTVFWAFCSDLSNTASDMLSPNAKSFGWASISFMTEGVNSPSVDSHTFIHETGHLLSLPDYYSYDYSGNSSGSQGGLAMMDMNIGDFDPFSKISLGWADPYYASEDCIVTLKPNQTTGDCLILADNWNGTAFDEYMLLDFVTPTGLNELDSSSPYIGRPSHFTTSGVRMYHIDARLCEQKVFNSSDLDSGYIDFVTQDATNDLYLKDDKVRDISSKGYVEPMCVDLNVPFEERSSGYTVLNSNSPSRCLSSDARYTQNRLISIIGANNLMSEVDGVYANNDFLFKEGDCWTPLRKYSKPFYSTTGLFNNGDNFSYVFTVLSITDEEAKIQIRMV